MIKAVVFDLDGVYFPKASDDYARDVAKRFDVPEEKVKETYDSEEMKEYKRSNITKEEYWDYVIKELGISATPDELIRMLIRKYHVRKDVAELVSKAKSKGIKAVIFTNNFPERIRLLDEKFDFLKDFDIVILSYEVGETKPNKKMLEALLERTGCRPEEIFIIDDQKNNIEGMQERGFPCLLYKNIDQLKKELKERGII